MGLGDRRLRDAWFAASAECCEWLLLTVREILHKICHRMQMLNSVGRRKLTNTATHFLKTILLSHTRRKLVTRILKAVSLPLWLLLRLQTEAHTCTHTCIGQEQILAACQYKQPHSRVHCTDLRPFLLPLLPLLSQGRLLGVYLLRCEGAYTFLSERTDTLNKAPAYD